MDANDGANAGCTRERSRLGGVVASLFSGAAEKERWPGLGLTSLAPNDSKGRFSQSVTRHMSSIW